MIDEAVVVDKTDSQKPQRWRGATGPQSNGPAQPTDGPKDGPVPSTEKVKRSNPPPDPSSPPPVPLQYRVDGDDAVHTTAPPIADSPNAAPQAVNDVLGIHLHDAEHHSHQQSTGWGASVAVHGLLLLLLFFVLAPADLGGANTLTLLMSLADKEQPQLEDTIKFAKEVAPTQAPDTKEPEDAEAKPPDPPKPDPNPQLIPVVPNFQGAGNGAANGEEANRNQNAGGGARGSFFGIDAVGHEFVYILDMSGSMEGRRFLRASSELIRSVGELDDTQNFYVLLFNGNATQMFDGDSVRPQPIAATKENKERLSAWLAKKHAGGSTDPRSSLRTAIKMDPSAIFILSDGEFDEQKQGRKRKQPNVLGGNTDTFSIVEMAKDKMPIHAIAFEDPRSCKNMQKIADMTGGEYHFAQFQDAAEAGELLDTAMAILERGGTEAATELLKDVVELHDQTEAGQKALHTLGQLLSDRIGKQLGRGDLAGARDTLIELTNHDRNGNATDAIQRVCFDDYVAALEGLDPPERDAEYRKLAKALQSNAPRSELTQRALEPLAEPLLEQAESFVDKDDLVAAISTLDRLDLMYPHTQANLHARDIKKRINEKVLAEAEQMYESGDVVAASINLRKVAENFDGVGVGQQARAKRETIARQLLAELRDATVHKDARARREASDKLDAAFGNDSFLTSVRREFAAAEVQAGRMLKQADAIRRRAADKRGEENAIKQYQRIVEQFPDTLAAQKAAIKIEELTPENDDMSAEEAMLEQMLLQAQ